MSEGERPLGLSRHPTEDWDAHETSTAKEGESKEKSKKPRTKKEPKPATKGTREQPKRGAKK